jgi:hypothetical protein
MDRNTTKKGTYQLRKEHHGEQQGSGSGSGKDKDKGKDKLDAIWEECCRSMDFNYAKVHRELNENVKEFTSLWKYHTHNEMMPRELYNFYNAVTTNKHEFLLLEKRSKALRFGAEPSEVGYHTYVDWTSKMPSDNPEINKDWSMW